MRRILLDTGVLVALLDASENEHGSCSSLFRDLRARLVTTEPVLTESVYLLGPDVRAQRACIEFVTRGGATLVPQSTRSLERAATLMRKYSDVPMDLADATLVVLAEELGTSEVLTLDRRGFSTYRIRGRKPFDILPEAETR
jgi:predicted nucleic acid-binding protein